jgi:hypothetical protein
MAAAAFHPARQIRTLTPSVLETGAYVWIQFQIDSHVVRFGSRLCENVLLQMILAV